MPPPHPHLPASRLAPLRTPADLAGERGGYAPWCGPTVLAQVAGVSYAAACTLLRTTRPDGYGQGEIVTTYWSDLLLSLDRAGIVASARPLPARPTLCQLARRLPPGWWMVRVTSHFLLLETDAGGARVFDNRLHGAPLTGRTHGRCRATHLAHLPGGIRG